MTLLVAKNFFISEYVFMVGVRMSHWGMAVNSYQLIVRKFL